MYIFSYYLVINLLFLIILGGYSRTGQIINYSNLAKNVGVGLRTIKNWISILISSYIIFEISPYHTNINKLITKSSKIYFYDSGLLSYLLNINSVNEYEHNALKGQVFENFVMSETIKKYENNYGINGMFFYRDSNKLEADLILKKSNEIKIYEVKSGELIKDSAFKKIKSLCKVLNCHQANAGIIYSGNYSLNKNDISIISVKEWLLR